MRALSKVGVIAATTLLILTVSFIAHAQRQLLDCNSCSTDAYRPKNPGAKIVVRYRDRIVHVTPTKGTLVIVAEPNAYCRLEYLKPNGEVNEETPFTIPRSEQSIIINDLSPGRYRVTAEGYRASNGLQEVKIEANKYAKVELQPITYNVTIRLNASSGKLYYAKSGEVEKSVDIQNNLANLSNLIGGDYTIKVDPDDAAFKQFNTTLRVPGESVVSYTLDRLESRDFLGATASDWSLPGGWYFSAGKIMVKSAGVALPSDATYRNYKDFQLSAQAKMVNGVAASFVVHAVDPQNYYLIQITGQNADEPYVLRGYIVRNGSAQRFGRTIPISQFSETLKQGKFFQVILAMTGNEIVVKVQDSETGDLLKLGILPDPSNSFRIGAVGIAARNNEQNEISQFSICVKCQTP
jgi:hypothetical protein